MDVQAEARRIEARLTAAGYTVAEMLRKAGVDAGTWQRIKHGKRTPLVTTWARISETTAMLLPEPDKTPPTNANGLAS